jgi:hypothetical protein
MRELWAGGIVLDPADQASIDERRRGRHVVNVGAHDESPFLTPETRLFTWTRTMSKDDLVALSTTYSAVITMQEDERQRHLNAMRRFLDTHESFAHLTVVDVPMRSYCWRAAKR